MPTSVPWLRLISSTFPFAAFEEVEVHPVDHFRPVVGLGAPGSRLDREEAVSVVVFARKQTLQLHLLHVLFERMQRVIGFGQELFVLRSHFQRGLTVFQHANRLFQALGLGLQQSKLFDGGVGRIRVIPEISGFHLPSKICSLAYLRVVVKEGHGWSRSALRGLQRPPCEIRNACLDILKTSMP